MDRTPAAPSPSPPGGVAEPPRAADDGRTRVGRDAPPGPDGVRLPLGGVARAVIEASPSAIYAVDPDGRVLLWNPAAARMFGWDAHEVLGRPLPFVPPAASGEFDRIRKATLAGRPQRDVELDRVRRDGTPIRISVSTAPVRDHRGRVVGAMGVATDITDRHRTEQELRRVTARSAAVLANVSDAVVIVDADGTIRWVSGNPRPLLGLADEDVIGRAVTDLAHPDDRDAVRAALGDVASRPGGELRGVFRSRTVDGRTVHLEALAVNLLHDEAVAGIVITVRDVTDWLRNEELLTSHAAVLEAIAGGEPLEDVLVRLRSLVAARCAVTDVTVDHPAPDGPGPRWGTAPDGGHGGWWRTVPAPDGSGPWVLSVTPDRPRPPADHERRVLNLAARTLEVALRHADQQARLAHLAMHDPLTGLPNRALVTDRLEHALRRAHRTGRRVGVLFVDLDHFKVVNDTLGHPAGDQLLRLVADRVRGAVRETDTVGRFGGDELVVVCEDVTDASHLRRLAQRVLTAVSAPLTVAGELLAPTVSVGAALGDGTEPADRLLSAADAAMYDAKAAGRARVALARPRLRDGAPSVLRVAAELGRAVSRRGIVPVFQPVVDTTDGSLMGLEVLARWRHPELGAVPPDRFVAVAEDHGLVVALTEAVLERAVEELTGGDFDPRRTGPGWRLAVNLSPRDLPESAAVLERVTTAAGVPPERLVVEITEGILVDDRPGTRRALRRLRELGVGVAIDDFGTGFASLTYLQRFPVTVLKIDRAFTVAEDDRLLRAVTGLASALDLVTVAEGVETAAQLDRVVAVGCRGAQGWHLAAPAPADRIGDAVAAARRAVERTTRRMATGP